jgi:beta-lactamase regulating signal transducer with metallopeptidase domain
VISVLTTALDHLWQSSLFLMVMALIARWMRSDAAKIRSALWAAASVKFLVPLSLLVTLGSSIPIDPTDVNAWGVESVQFVFQPLATAGSLAPQSELPAATDAALAPPTIAIAVWLLGAGALLARRIRRWMQVRHIVARSKPHSTSQRSTPVRCTDAVHAPAVAGVFYPVLLLPHGMQETLSAEELSAVIAHEQEHVRRRDNLISAVHGGVEILFWFYPPVWWLGKRLVLDRELACDEAVLIRGHARHVYAEAILKVCERFALRAQLHGISAVTDSDLHQRIEAIMNNTPMLQLNRLKSTALCLVFGAAIAGPIATGIAAPKEPGQESTRATGAENPAGSLLGRHTINLRLKPMPAAQVLQMLSNRSKAVARMPDPPADEGRPWEVEGAGALDGLFVTVDFTETAVEEVVSQVLGCIGFGYRERDDRIELARIATPRSSNECRSVAMVSSPATASAQSSAAISKSYTWETASISAFDFVQRWSTETARNIMMLHSEVEELKQIPLRVSVSNMRDEEALGELVKCIGWTYEKTSIGFNLSKPERVSPSPCRGFTLL